MELFLVRMVYFSRLIRTLQLTLNHYIPSIECEIESSVCVCVLASAKKYI